MGVCFGLSFRVLFILYLCNISTILFAEDLSEGVAEDIKPKPVFVPPSVPDGAYLALYFSSPDDLHEKLILSKARKEGTDESIAKYDGVWSVEVPHSSAIDGDYGLVLKTKAKHHAVLAKLRKPLKFDANELVIQYEVKFQDGVDCGGAYIKLLRSSNAKLEDFNDKTPYTIMFGPDKCGADYKFHFIFQHKNPRTNEYEEKHAKKVSSDLEHYFSDKKTHLYTLVLRSDNTFERYIDQVKVQSGSLLNDFQPPVNPPSEIEDPSDQKPADWDDREKIVDSSATKPDDWDESAPELIPDESAVKPAGWLDEEQDMIPDPAAEPPADWDREIDGTWDAPKIKNPKCVNAPGCGEWHRPMIPNPKYKGKWFAPLINNPAYKGVWKPRMIPNPNYFQDLNPYSNLAEVNALGLELWSMSDEIVFDNFLIVDSKRAADEFAGRTWAIKQKAERLADPKAQSVVDAIRETYNEKPWIIFVVGIVCTLPILICCIYFCRSPSKDSIHKKTDMHTPDDMKDTYESSKDMDEATELNDSGEEDAIPISKGSEDESDSNKAPGSKEDTGGDSNDDSAAPERESPKQAVRKRRSRRE